MTKPNWDLLIIGANEDPKDYDWFPAGDVRDCMNLLALEGLRFRNVYLTSGAIETGSANLFHTLYRSAKLSHGRVLHISDYDMEYE
jgi:hypothetical protein